MSLYDELNELMQKSTKKASEHPNALTLEQFLVGGELSIAKGNTVDLVLDGFPELHWHKTFEKFKSNAEGIVEWNCWDVEQCEVFERCALTIDNQQVFDDLLNDDELKRLYNIIYKKD